MKRFGLLKSCLGVLGRMVARRPVLTLVAIIALTLAAVPMAMRSVRSENVEKDLLKVLTAGLPRAEAYKRLAEDFGVIDRHFLLIELQNPDDLPAAKRFADILAEKLCGDTALIRTARSRIALNRFLRDHAHLYLDDQIAGQLTARTTDEAIARAMQRNRELLKISPEMKQRVLLDPLNFYESLREVAAKRTGGDSSPIDVDGYMVSPDNRLLMVSAQPTRPAAQGEKDGFTARLLRHTRESVKAARAECFAAQPEVSSRLKVSIGGSYAALQEGGQLIVGGVLKSALTSFLGVLLLFALVYRRPLAFVFLGLPLAVPVIWTLALAPLLLPEYGGRISVVGGAFAAVLLGLGIDYAVHLYNRFAAERAAGSSPEEAAERSVRGTGEGIFYGALTTVIAFAGMTLTNFRGFKEFGRLAALGVALTAAVLLVGLPAALTLLARLRGNRSPAPRPFSFGLGAVAQLVRARPGTLVSVGLLALVLSVAAMFANPDPAKWGVWFEPDIGKLGPPHHLEKAGEVNRRAAQAFGMDYREISVVIRGATSSEALEETARLCARARKCKMVRSVRGLVDLVPAPSAQRRSLAIVAKLDLGRLPGRIDKAAVAAGFKPGAFASCPFSTFVAGMAERARKGRLLDPQELAESDDPESASVRELVGYVYCAPVRQGEGHRTHTLLSVVGGREGRGLESADYERMARELGVDGRGALMTSHMLVVYELKDSVRHDLFMMIAVVAGTVLLMMFVALRKPVYVLLAVSPVILGGAYMLLTMKATGLALNYVNILVFPVLIGIGVDNAVHLIIRYRQEGGNAGAALMETGRALVVCSLTTVFGFLSLLTCPHWGLKSLGITVAIGMGFVLLASVFFVPAVLEMASRRNRPRPQDGDSARSPRQPE